MLRCDDCIKYHLGKSHELGITTEQMYEVFAVANIVGGTIVIPHTRRAAEYWEELLGMFNNQCSIFNVQVFVKVFFVF